MDTRKMVLGLVGCLALFGILNGAAFAQVIVPAVPSDGASSNERFRQPLQFGLGEHIVGFMPQRVYFTGLDHMLSVEFVGTHGVEPQVSNAGERGSRGIPPLSNVTYRELWRGIDVAYLATADKLVKSVYLAAPNADISQIQLRYSAPVELQTDGSLRLRLPNGRGDVTESAPIAWQEIEGKRVDVAVSFRVKGRVVGFDAARYDLRFPLVIDPTYAWHTFYGVNTYANAIATDGHGAVYVAGQSAALWYGDGDAKPLHKYHKNDIVILKLDSSGAYQWHTFYGSAELDAGTGIAIDGENNVYVSGFSQANWQGGSNASPLHAHSHKKKAAPPEANLFVLKLNSDGKYQWHTFYGSIVHEYTFAINADSAGRVTVAGASGDSWRGDGGAKPLHPHAGSSASNTPPDITVLQLESNGAYRWHTFYGAYGGQMDEGTAVTQDDSGNIYVTGHSTETWRGDGNTNPLHPHAGIFDSDIFVLKLNRDGGYQWHTFYGGAGAIGGTGIDVDESANVYIAAVGPAWLGDGGAAPLHAFSGGMDMAVLKLDSAGTYQWHTFYGSAAVDAFEQSYDIVSYQTGVAVVGYSNADWKLDPWRQPLNFFNESHQSRNITVLALDPAGTYQWHTFYGGDSWAIAADGQGNLVIAGSGSGNWKDDQGHDPLHKVNDDLTMVVLKLAIPATPPEVPALVSPQNTALVTTPQVTLDWSDAASRTYYNVELRRGKNAGRLVLLKSLTASEFKTPTLLNTKLYHWRVQACNELGCSDWSEWWTFKARLEP